MYLFAALCLFSIAASEFLLPLTGKLVAAFVAFGLPGLAILAFGFSLLFKFLREYPHPPSEDSHVSR